jgi:hypothetical protein
MLPWSVDPDLAAGEAGCCAQATFTDSPDKHGPDDVWV